MRYINKRLENHNGNLVFFVGSVNIVGSTENFFTFTTKRGTYQTAIYCNGSTITKQDNVVPVVNYGTVALAGGGTIYELIYSIAGKYLEFISKNGVTNMQIVQRNVGDKFVITDASYNVYCMAISFKM